MNLLDIAQSGGRTYRRVSSLKGGEYHGPCPSCGGNDRFHIWPSQGDNGTYWCRQCGGGGDAIQYLIDYEGMSFRDACKHLGKDLPEVEEYRAPRFKNTAAATFEPRKIDDPHALWVEHATKFVHHCHEQLLASPEQLKWLADRGIDLQGVKRHRLGWNPGEKGKDTYRVREAWGLETLFKPDDVTKRKLWLPIGIVIPKIVEGFLRSVRIRIPNDRRDPVKPLPYYLLPGSATDTYITRQDAKAWIIVEAELDAIAVDCAAGDLTGAMAMGNNSAKPTDRAHQLLLSSLWIGNALDYDPQTNAQGNYENSGGSQWPWWRKQYPQAERWPVPVGKDPGDAFKAGIDLRQWIMEGLPPVLTLPPAPAPRKVETKPAETETKAPEPIKEASAAATNPGFFPWRTKTGRLIYIADNEIIVAKNRKPGEAWFTTAEMLAMKGLPGEEIEGVINAKERILDTKEIFGGTVTVSTIDEPAAAPQQERKTGSCYWPAKERGAA